MWKQFVINLEGVGNSAKLRSIKLSFQCVFLGTIIAFRSALFPSCWECTDSCHFLGDRMQSVEFGVHATYYDLKDRQKVTFCNSLCYNPETMASTRGTVTGWKSAWWKRSIRISTTAPVWADKRHYPHEYGLSLRPSICKRLSGLKQRYYWLSLSTRVFRQALQCSGNLTPTRS